jgi:hypothetical protein
VSADNSVSRQLGGNSRPHPVMAANNKTGKALLKTLSFTLILLAFLRFRWVPTD